MTAGTERSSDGSALSCCVTLLTTYLWKKSSVSALAPSGVQETGKHRRVLFHRAFLSGTREPATQSASAYVTLIVPPPSVSTVLIRHQFIAGAKSVASTRFGFCTPTKCTSGTVTAVRVPSVVPARPVWLIPSSHSPARVVSPGSGNVCLNVHWSTGLPPALVVRVPRRLVLQNVGLPT
ncbi:hypothetical protein ABT369_32795 [Dactylosporangium sp. NPDC000244]|uniref:hypothetical protein n=1 Tax=Dactylosporangium sp. NPDC000244 TaxID=3154365 RepID=UPI0033193D32